jgi:hypothetical protein
MNDYNNISQQKGHFEFPTKSNHPDFSTGKVRVGPPPTRSELLFTLS